MLVAKKLETIYSSIKLCFVSNYLIKKNNIYAQ